MARHKSTGLPMTVPCGRCTGCRLEQSRQWAVRMMHEAQTASASCFLTLTYDDAHLPAWGGLEKDVFPAFMKRLRNKWRVYDRHTKRYRYTKRVSYFHCGEYGEETNRPHYHACLFGWDFPDRQFWDLVNGNELYRDKECEDLWEKGRVLIGELTFESAAYVARYCTKKVRAGGADGAEEYEGRYERVNPLTGEVRQVEKEFATMSKRPAIGAAWFEKYGGDVFPSDEVIVRGRSTKPPRFYDRLFQKENPVAYEIMKATRSLERDRGEHTDERLQDREKCAKARMSQRERGF